MMKLTTRCIRPRRISLRAHYSSGNPQTLKRELAIYANKTPTGVPLLTMMQTGRGEFIAHAPTCEGTNKQRTIYQIAMFLHREVPIRLAHLHHDLDSIPIIRDLKGISEIRENYASSFDQVRSARVPNNIEDEKAFAEISDSILNKYSNVLIAMARSIQEIRLNLNEMEFADQKDIHRFLDSFYMSRLGIRTVVGQYLSLRAHENRPGTVGLISEKVSPANVIRDAIEDAKFMCERVYGDAPEVSIHGQVDLTFQYDPSHVHFIMLELLKNSMRATMEKHGEAGNDENSNKELPRVRVVIADGVDNEDVVIKISDEGGGICRSNMSRIWSYLFTTADPEVQKSMLGGSTDFSTSSPLAGLGYGLPIARTYVRYFGGDLKLMSMEGYGTDAYVYLTRVGTHDEPVLSCRVRK
mmetsp:Transcript_29363/g.34569  ORF Transcript_29363/g.34569 Transcript_29363/m.34569 type:complete len:411 (+) Transcript_29363:109-1341(+)